jgi:glycosyltransferase involved in cell wall biosynthesis
MKGNFNILLLAHSLSPNGATKVAIQTFEGLRETVSLHTLALCGGELETRFGELGPVQVMSEMPFQNQLSPVLVKRLLPLIPRRLPFHLNGRLLYPWRRHRKPALVYVNSIAALPLLPFLKLEGIPVLLHVHELEVPLRIYAQHHSDLLLERPTRYLAVSEAVKGALIQCGVRTEKISTVHAFIQEESFAPLAPSVQKVASTNAAETEPACLVVGGAGELNWCKGNQLWLLMAAELTQMLGRDRVRFVWVGVRDNDEGCFFRYMAQQLGLDRLVEFVPYTSDPLKHFARFDVFAMTSWEESASLVVLENMSLEKAVVCFAGSGGPPELLGDTGVIVKQFDPRTMAQAIAALARDPNKRASLGHAAHQRVKEAFVAAVQTPKILRVMETTIQGNSVVSKKHLFHTAGLTGSNIQPVKMP